MPRHDLVDRFPRNLRVGFACFVTCLYKEEDMLSVSNKVLGLRIPGFELGCIMLALHCNSSLEMYLECDGLYQTLLLRALEELNLYCISIYTFGPEPTVRGAPEALARIRHRVGRDGFSGYYNGVPEVIQALEFDLCCDMQSWTRFTADQIHALLLTDVSRPGEIVEWCVVICSGNTSKLPALLNEELPLRSTRPYYIKGFLCSRAPMSARIYLEVEPVVKTVLLKCLMARLQTPVEILTFPEGQHAGALAVVSELKGEIITGGCLAEVSVAFDSGVVTHFTRCDLAIWDCVIPEPPPAHWSVAARDMVIDQLRAGMLSLRKEKEFREREVAFFSEQNASLMVSLLKMTKERDAPLAGDGLVGWRDMQRMRAQLEEKNALIARLRARLSDSEGT